MNLQIVCSPSCTSCTSAAHACGSCCQFSPCRRYTYIGFTGSFRPISSSRSSRKSTRSRNKCVGRPYHSSNYMYSKLLGACTAQARPSRAPAVSATLHSSPELPGAFTLPARPRPACSRFTLTSVRQGAKTAMPSRRRSLRPPAVGLTTAVPWIYTSSL